MWETCREEAGGFVIYQFDIGQAAQVRDCKEEAAETGLQLIKMLILIRRAWKIHNKREGDTQQYKIHLQNQAWPTTKPLVMHFLSMLVIEQMWSER